MTTTRQFTRMPSYKPEDIRQKLLGLNIQIKEACPQITGSLSRLFKNKIPQKIANKLIDT